MISMKKYKFTYAQISALGFLVIILIGAFLLMLPISSRNGQYTPFINALFTSTSATCVTGLTVYDTYNYFSPFGQVVIISLIQIGGLGFMIVATLFSFMLKRKIGLRERGFIKESVSTIHIGGVVRLAKHILFGTFIFEAVGAFFLSLRFSRDMGIKRGIFNGIFHSISAFCNAGFDLMGRIEPGSSLTRYSNDWIVNIVIILLIIIGGIGFLVWEDIYMNKFKFSKYKLHTKIVIVTTLGLTVISTILFYLIEKNKYFAGMSNSEAFLNSLFQSVTPRTAGFNTTDTARLSDSSILLTIILMVIGGSPGSTAGGIKTTTFVVVIVSAISSIKKREDLNVFNRRLEPDIIRRAYNVVTVYLFYSLLATMLICAIDSLPLKEVIFEVSSAFSTVGMTMGITRSLSIVSKIIIMLLMYCGRIGNLSVALAFSERKEHVPIRKPVEKISIG